MGFFDFFKKKKETAMDEIKTKCIERPDYVEECFLVERFDDDECRAVWENNKERFITLANETVHELFNDPYVCDDAEDTYPRRSVVTGEWYVGEVHSFKQNGKILVWFTCRCLGYGENGVGDYYGINQWFEQDESGEWVSSCYDTVAI